jgi:ribonuclease D
LSSFRGPWNTARQAAFANAVNPRWKGADSPDNQGRGAFDENNEAMETITSTAKLAAFCSRAAEFDFVTVDTEFLRETTYWPKLCLVQVATSDEAVLIDPLVNGLDLKPLLALMADADVTKVFHAARQDIEIFVKLSGLVPESIFYKQMSALFFCFGV